MFHKKPVSPTPKEIEFYKVCDESDANLIEKFISSHGSFNQNTYHKGFLRISYSRKSFEEKKKAMDIILSKCPGAIDAVDEFHHPALFSAATDFDDQLVVYLISKRANVNITSHLIINDRSDNNVTPLAATLYWLSTKGFGMASFEAFEKYRLPEGGLKVIKVLCERGADRNHPSVLKVLDYIRSTGLKGPEYILERYNECLSVVQESKLQSLGHNERQSNPASAEAHSRDSKPALRP